MGCTSVATLLLLLVAIISFSQSEEIKGKKYETLLFDNIFNDYDKRSRPVKDYHTPVVVNFSLSIMQIIKVDEKHQVVTSNILRSLHWTDDFLKWNPEIYGNIAVTYMSRSQMWTPDIRLYNSAAFDKDIEMNAKNVVTYNGIVVDAVSMIVQSTCKIDVTWFPFDEQKCFLVFGSWTSSSKHLLLQLDEFGMNEIEYIDNGEWKLLGVSATSTSLIYPCCPNDTYVKITYTIHLKRRAFYYFFNLLVPCFLIGFLAILNFTLPPESGEKLPLGATILFSLIVFLNMISGSMPANSDAVPLLGTYFNSVMFTIALSVVSTIVVNLNDGNSKEVQGLLKKVFLCWLPRILCMNSSPNIVNNQENDNKSGDTITLYLHRSGRMDSVATFSLHSNKTVNQWTFIAAVVDRMCLIFSLLITFVSVTSYTREMARWQIVVSAYLVSHIFSWFPLIISDTMTPV